MFRKLFFAMVLSVCAFAAFALPKPSEVKAAFTSGNYTLAERLLNEVMVEKPTAMVHYQLGQVYAAQGKHADALNKFRQAQTLDPSLKFASSPSAFMQLMSSEQARISVPAPQVSPDVKTVSVSTPYNGPSAMSVTGVLLTLALIAGAIIMIINKRKKAAEVAEIDAMLSEKKNTLIVLAKNLEDAVLIAKTSNHTDAMKTRLLDNISTTQSRVRAGLADLKDMKDITESRILALTGSVETVVAQAATGIPVPVERPQQQSAPRDVRKSTAATSTTSKIRRQSPSPAPSPTPAVVHHYRDPVHVHTSDSGSGMLAGMLIGQALNNHHYSSTGYTESSNRFDQGSSSRDSYDAPSPAPAPVLDEPIRYSSPSPSPADDSWDSSSSSSSSDDSSSSSNDSY